MTLTIAEMEVFIQSNSKLPELSTDRWKYPSHKVNLLLKSQPAANIKKWKERAKNCAGDSCARCAMLPSSGGEVGKVCEETVWTVFDFSGTRSFQGVAPSTP